MALWKYCGEVWEEEPLRRFLLSQSGEYDESYAALFANDPLDDLVVDLQMRYGVTPDEVVDHIPVRLTKMTQEEIVKRYYS
jgi:hypothetical protein